MREKESGAGGGCWRIVDTSNNTPHPPTASIVTGQSTSFSAYMPSFVSECTPLECP